MDVDNSAKKAVESIGKNKANRQAQMAQKRGLQTSGKATNSQVKKQTLKVRGGAANAAKSTPKGTNKPSLKISFNPTQLSQTTAAEVQRQIMGVLSKAPKGVAPGAPKPKSRTIISNQFKQRSQNMSGNGGKDRIKR